jgi:CheY-like chemotaxis protein
MGVPLRLLIVEDLDDAAVLLVRECKRGGYAPVFERVDTAAAMKVALDRQAWDVVLSDHQMPQFDSLAALRLIRERELDLPFIIVSGNIGEEVVAAAMTAGAKVASIRSASALAVGGRFLALGVMHWATSSATRSGTSGTTFCSGVGAAVAIALASSVGFFPSNGKRPEIAS